MKKWAFIALFTLSHLSIAQDKHQHSAHTHGLAELTIVHENKQLVIGFQAPAINMLGFEHKPHNSAQRDRVTAISVVVGKPDKLFSINPACHLTRQEARLPFTDKDQGHQHNGDHKGHDDHDHDNADHDKHKSEEHRDIHLTYEWTCQVADTLKVDVLLFDAFPGFEKIQAQWVVGQRQGAATLDKNNAVLELKL